MPLRLLCNFHLGIKIHFIGISFNPGQEQRLESEPAERQEHWRRVRGASLRAQPRHHRRRPRILLELAEERPE